MARIRKILFFCATVTVVIIFLLNFFPYWRRQDWVNSSHKRKVICPEHYAGPKHKSETKWVTEDCDYAVPMHELVTIILFKSDQRVVSAVQRSLPGVTIIMPGDGQTAVSSSVKYVTSPKTATAGEIWNKLINASVTPYAFLASNVLNFSMDLLGLQRLVRVLSETPGTEVVGGATRNATGHWKAGCYQLELQNYVLSYRKGYHESISECMRCDHVDAPFLAEMWLLKKVPMNKKLPAEMVLPDFFLRVFRSQSSLVCPDVMITATDLLTSPAAGKKKQWKSLALKWQLNRIHLRFPRSSILHKFNCSEVELNCVTKVEVHGVWITAPPNPGLYARGRYGVEILKHAMSWRHTGKKSDLEPYDAGRFRATCSDGHHACLDTMPADGSIFYNVPE